MNALHFITPMGMDETHAELAARVAALARITYPDLIEPEHDTHVTEWIKVGFNAWCDAEWEKRQGIHTA
jgi:hypothetical protein